MLLVDSSLLKLVQAMVVKSCDKAQFQGSWCLAYNEGRLEMNTIRASFLLDPVYFPSILIGRESPYIG